MQTPDLSKKCALRWDDLPGTDARRYCGRCDQSVHNLSAMERNAATRFVADNPNACIRFLSDSRGRVLFRSRRLAIVAAAASMAGCAMWDGTDESSTPEEGWVDVEGCPVPAAPEAKPDAPKTETPAPQAQTTAPKPPPLTRRERRAQRRRDREVVSTMGR